MKIWEDNTVITMNSHETPKAMTDKYLNGTRKPWLRKKPLSNKQKMMLNSNLRKYLIYIDQIEDFAIKRKMTKLDQIMEIISEIRQICAEARKDLL